MIALDDDGRAFGESCLTVLVSGETGVGKEQAARELAERCPRFGERIVVINCAAIPESLADAELFGYEPGAFTGANKLHRGVFEQADGGTVVLDEVGELRLPTQAKVLRVFDYGELRRLGGDRTIKVDVRIIAATNRDLRAMVARGEFREDLFYRLAVLEIRVPPLRERLVELPRLIPSVLQQVAKRMNCAVPALSSAALGRLNRHRWPGNVRELRNVLSRAMVLARGAGVIDEHVVTVALADGASVAHSPRCRVCLGELDNRYGRDNAQIARVLGRSRRRIEQIRQGGIEKLGLCERHGATE